MTIHRTHGKMIHERNLRGVIILNPNEIFITGYAKLPQGITAAELYTVIAVGMLVDEKTGEIYDVDCSLATDIAKTFVRKLLVGTSITEFKLIEDKFNEKYHGSAKKALLSALKIINEKYLNLINR